MAHVVNFLSDIPEVSQFEYLQGTLTVLPNAFPLFSSAFPCNAAVECPNYSSSGLQSGVRVPLVVRENILGVCSIQKILFHDTH